MSSKVLLVPVLCREGLVSGAREDLEQQVAVLQQRCDALQAEVGKLACCRLLLLCKPEPHETCQGTSLGDRHVVYTSLELSTLQLARAEAGAALSESDVRDEVASEMRELLCQMEANYKVPPLSPLQADTAPCHSDPRMLCGACELQHCASCNPTSPHTALSRSGCGQSSGRRSRRRAVATATAAALSSGRLMERQQRLPTR
jgi:hypothetical protein